MDDSDRVIRVRLVAHFQINGRRDAPTKRSRRPTGYLGTCSRCGAAGGRFRGRVRRARPVPTNLPGDKRVWDSALFFQGFIILLRETGMRADGRREDLHAWDVPAPFAGDRLVSGSSSFSGDASHA